MARPKALKWWLAGAGTLLVVLAAGAALTVSRLRRSRSPSNESSAIAALRAYVGAQLAHLLARGKYARGLKALVGHGLDPEIAAAQFSAPGARPYRGYYFSDPMPKLLLFAFPAGYGRTGRNTFMIDRTGTAFQRDLGGAMPPSAKPGPPPEPKVVAVSVPYEDTKALREGNTAFALDLYRRFARAEGGGFLFSPHGISTAMAMCRAGARGDTAGQMASALHFTLPPGRLHPAFQSMVHDLARSVGSKGCELGIANCLWGDRRFRIRKEYLDLLRTHYGSEVRQADFAGDRVGAAREINAWAMRESRGRIPGIIQPSEIPPQAVLLCANAVYFKGKWKNQFEEWATRDEPFELTGGERVEVPMMRQNAEFGYAEADGLQVLRMPYIGSGFAMIVLLPAGTSSIAELEAHLTQVNLEAWLGALRDTLVRVYLPRFSIDSRFDLMPPLRAMGIVDAFIAGKCDLSGIGEGIERVARVNHRALVEVDEEGTVAIALTHWIPIGADDGLDPPPPPVFRADHPFVFLIIDTRTRGILFIGRVTDPREDAPSAAAAGPS
jgi:serpin B